MVLQKLWVSQNFSQILRVSQSGFFFNGYVHLAGSFSIRRCLRVSIFCKVKGLEVPIFFFLNDIFSSLDIGFHYSNFQFPGKSQS